MAPRPIQRRGTGDSLGRLGRSTLARASVGGGHDALIGRLLGKGGSEFAGLRHPSIVASYFEVEIVSPGIFTISEDLVPESWPENQPCLVTASVVLAGDQPGPEEHPEFTAMLMAADQVPAADSTYDFAGMTLGISVEPMAALSLSWIYQKGIPHLLAAVRVNPATWADLTPGGSPAGGEFLGIQAWTRVLPL